MLLCLDAGNTRLKYGLRDDSGWRLQGALAYPDFDDLAAQLPQRPRRIVACNVAGEAIRLRIAALAGSLDVPLAWLIGSATACGVTNGYDTPQQLGADRWAALIGARALHAGPAVVVIAGHYRAQPTNTDDAIVSGAIHATLGAIARIHATLGEDALCLLAGGAAHELAPHLGLPLRLIDNLVLEGLARYSTAVAA